MKLSASEIATPVFSISKGRLTKAMPRAAGDVPCGSGPLMSPVCRKLKANSDPDRNAPRIRSESLGKYSYTTPPIP